MRVILVLLVVCLLAWNTPPPSQVIRAENVARLHSAVLLDFAAVEALDLRPASGVFALDDSAASIITFANTPDASPLSTAVVWDAERGEILHTFFVGENQYDRRLTEAGLLVARGDGAQLFDIFSGESQRVLTTDAPLLAVWMQADGVFCGETSPDLSGVAFIVCNDERDPVPVPGGDFVRIGRVAPPLMVTVTESGAVSRWDLTTGIAIAQADAGDVAVFGAVNADGSHLAWRDPLSSALYLLDFTSGENRQIAELDGSFIAYILLAAGADVIFALDPMSARGAVWAWDVATGEKFDLGSYRPCSRQPDLARLSADGTALVIGCDTGLDVWRLSD